MQIKRLKSNDIKNQEKILKSYIRQLKKDNIEEVERIYKNMCEFTKDGTAIILGAIQNEKIIGFIWGYKKIENQNIMHINYFFVNENYRSKGVGSILLKELENKVENIEETELLVNNKNIRALKFYEKNGFKIKEKDIEKIKLYKIK